MLAIDAVPQLRCDRCGNTTFSDLWRCTSVGRSDCPFQRLESSQRRYGLAFVIFIFGFIFVAAGISFTAFMGSHYGVTWSSIIILLVFLTIFVGFGGFACLLALYLAFGSAQSLLSNDRGTVWQESRLAGFLLGRRVAQRFNTESPPSRVRLMIPASIAALTETPSWNEIKQQIRNLRQMPEEERKRNMNTITANDAPRALFLAVVLDLASRGVIAVSRVRTWTARFGSVRYKEEEEIVLTPGERFQDGEPEGALEQQVVRVVSNWSHAPEVSDQPLGPNGKLLVRTILDSDCSSPGNNLTQIAAKDAIAKGMAERTSRWLPSFKFRETVKPTQESDHRTLVAWVGQHETTDWVRRLGNDIQKGIQSRESSD